MSIIAGLLGAGIAIIFHDMGAYDAAEKICNESGYDIEDARLT